MEKTLQTIPGLLADMITVVCSSLTHNWIPLSLAILTAALIKAHIDTEKLKQALLGKPKVSILSSVAVGAFTPLCACGTMAVVIGLLTTALPWGPIMAFLTSSPLISPHAFILLTGVVGFRFAVALAVASIIIGLASGFITHMIEKKTAFLKDQTRFQRDSQVQTCDCSKPDPVPVTTCGCSDTSYAYMRDCTETDSSVLLKFFSRIKLPETAKALWNVGVKQILLFFSIFVAVGYLINYFVPTSIIVALFSPDSIFAVPLAALIGLPLYVTGESAVPIIRSLIAEGAGEGAMMAFMITGPATSAWVIAGITAFMKKRVIGLYLLYILAGGILMGYLYNLILAMGV